MNLYQGQLLTSHIKSNSNDTTIELVGNGNCGPFKLIFPDQPHVFFIEDKVDFSPPVKNYSIKETNLKNFSHLSVKAVYLKSYNDIRAVRDYCEIKGIRTFEMDVNPQERFLMERFIHGQVEFTGESKTVNGVKEFYNPQIRPFNGSFLLSSVSLDIETGVNGELYSIGLHFQKGQFEKQIVQMIGPNKLTNDDVKFYSSEKSLLLGFLEKLKEWDPDFIIGWHVIGFDLKFLEKKCIEHNLKLSIGRQDSQVRIDDKKGVGFFADTVGRVIIDGPPTLRSAFYKFKNFKLETVATELLGHGKDIDSNEGKVEEIERRFKEDKLSLAKYNILDCILVTQIFNHCDLFNLLTERSKISGLLYDRLNMSTAAFDHVYLPRIHRKGFVAPNRIDIERESESTGGLVLEPKEGLHKNIAILDFKSLYPTIIQTFKIDPYSKLNFNTDPLKTPNGFEFSKSQHILPDIIETLKNKRQDAKNVENNSLSQAIKILMNSFYGVMGSSRCRFYHADLPTAITTTGHWILRQSIDFLQMNGYETIYGDTDSVFVNLGSSDEKLAQKLAEDINGFLTNLIKVEFGLNSFLECEFEILFDKIFFGKMRTGTTAAKKKYVGVKNNNLIFKGMEFVRSDWTELAKNFQKQIFEKYFNNEPIDDFIRSYIQDLKSGFFDDQLVYTKKLSKAPKEYTKNIPIHVKAALKIDHTGPYRLKEVSYVLTLNGPEPINNNPGSFDYEHYIEKQLKPIADDILITQDMSFDSFITGDQLSFDL